MSSKISVTIDGDKLRELVNDHIRSVMGDVTFNSSDIRIEVKSKQNYKSEWENAEFRAVIETLIL